MVNTLFATREDFLRHAVNPLPLSAATGEKWFRLFREWGYVLSHPSIDDDEFDEWVDILRGWADALPPATRGAISRKIRESRNVEAGRALTELSNAMPAGLLFSYQRASEWAMVFDPWGGKRTIWATKGIG